MKSFILLLTLLMVFSACSPSPKSIQTSVAQTQAAWTPSLNPTSTSSPTRTSTSTPTKTPTALPTPVGPIEIAADPAKGFNWPYLLYVPSKIYGTNILVVPNNTGHPDNDFSVHERSAQQTMSSRISWANTLGVPLVVPIFPRFADITDGIMASQYLARGMLEKYWADKYPKIAREDLQLIAMLDDAMERLGSLGINVDPKIFIEGYSASAMFTSRFTILHPDRVRAAAFGGHGWAILPTGKWKDLNLPYPYGVSDIGSLTGQPFNLEEFKKVAIFAYMGSLDDNGWALPWYIGNGVNQSAFYSSFKNLFGSTAQQLSDSASQIYQALGCSATFVVYPNQDHHTAFTHDSEILRFFMSTDQTAYPPTPSSSIPIVMDGYASDWENIPPVKDALLDSSDPGTDISAYYFTQDDNYLDIMLQTRGPITNKTATLDIGLLLRAPDGKNQKFEFNINSDGSSYGGNYPDAWFPTLSVLVAWKEVVEIQIPKSIFNGSTFQSINYISLFTDVNGTWSNVDTIP